MCALRASENSLTPSAMVMAWRRVIEDGLTLCESAPESAIPKKSSRARTIVPSASMIHEAVVIKMPKLVCGRITQDASEARGTRYQSLLVAMLGRLVSPSSAIISNVVSYPRSPESSCRKLVR